MEAVLFTLKIMAAYILLGVIVMRALLYWTGSRSRPIASRSRSASPPKETAMAVTHYPNSQRQRDMLRHLELIGKLDDEPLTKVDRRTLVGLEKKNLVRRVNYPPDQTYWRLP